MCFLLRVKILEQFVETVKTVKGQRHQTAQTHICAALCSLLKVLQPGLVQGSSSTLSPRSYAVSLAFLLQCNLTCASAASGGGG